jgi:Na+-transporting methylmalonyl-CoA/oxaloacetate decarboxylase gamma subunit
MEPDLGVALQITAIGMGLVFAAIVVLWGVMALLVRLTAEKPVPGPAQEPAAASGEGAATAAPEARRARLARLAAAAAVGVALAEAPPGAAPAEPKPPTATVSAWQAAMRASQLKQRGPTR